MVRIRLRRMGKKKQPSYRVVVADSRSPRDGRFIEIIGFYNPRTEPETVKIKEDRALYWLSVGAQPTEAVARLLKKQGTLACFERLRQGEPLEALVAEAEEATPAELETHQEPAMPVAEEPTEKPEAPAGEVLEEDWRSIILTDDELDATEQLIRRDDIPQRVESIAYELLERRRYVAPGEKLEQIQDLLLPRLRLQLQESGRFIQFGNEWFLANLLRPVLPTEVDQAEKRLRQMEEPSPLSDISPAKSKDNGALAFSWNYRLDHDTRFDNVGTFETPLWFLRALEPPEVVSTPERLAIPVVSYTREYVYIIHQELKQMVQSLDDEREETAPPPAEFIQTLEPVRFVLNFAHLTAGTVPLTNRIRQVFPRPAGSRSRVTFIDARSGDRLAGWVMHEERYAWGLKEWYDGYLIRAGNYVTLQATETQTEIRVDFDELSQPRVERVRVARRGKDGSWCFEWQEREVRYRYDPLMFIAETRFEELDSLDWEAEQVGKPVFEIMCDLFPALSAVEGGSVHAKTLYQAVNLVRRCAPGTVFCQLSQRVCFDPVGEGYWTYDSDLRDIKVVYRTEKEVERREKRGPRYDEAKRQATVRKEVDKIIEQLDEKIPSLYQRVDSLEVKADEQARRL